MKSYEKAHAWKELFTLAITEKLEEGEIAEMCERVASAFSCPSSSSALTSADGDVPDYSYPDHLASRGKYVEAGRIWLDYGHDLPEAVSAFCKGRDFSEAYRVVRPLFSAVLRALCATVS
jgi:elongator complex protein 1